MKPTPSPRGRRLLRGLALSALPLAAAACRDQMPAPPLAPAGAAGSATRIDCTVTVANGEVRCGAPAAGGALRNLTLGGQGTYLRVVSSGTHYDGSAVFESSVAVQNLLDQPMGSADGTTVYGVNVFFASGPAVTSGTGTVEVANPDGQGTFTASGQPYFHYAEIIAPRGISQAKLWRFSVPNTVATFAFTLLVETRLQSEQGILRWERRAGTAGTTASLYDVWGSSPRNVYAVGSEGTILHYDGGTWAVIQRPVRFSLYGIDGAGARALYAVGEKGTMLRSDGNHWTVLRDPVEGLTLTDVAAPSADSVFAVGIQHDAVTGYEQGILLRSSDGGASWSGTLTNDTLQTFLLAVWAVSSREVYVVGYRISREPYRYEGIIMHSVDAGANWSTTLSVDERSRALHSVWADGPNSVYAAGYEIGEDLLEHGLVMHSTDGGATWGEVVIPEPNREIEKIYGTPDGTLFVAGQAEYESTGMVMRSTDGGAAWSDVEGSDPHGIWSVWASSATDVYTAGAVSLMRYDGSGWTRPSFAGDAGTESMSPGTSGGFQDVWAPGGGVVFAAGWRPGSPWDEGVVSRSDDGGATWEKSYFPGTKGVRLNGIWGTSASSLVAVGFDEAAGSGLIVRSTNGGQSWDTVPPPPSSGERQLFSVWGSAATDLYAVGLQYEPAHLRYDALILRSTNGGASWSAGTYASPELHKRSLARVYGSSAADVYAVGTDYDSVAGTRRGLIMHSVDGGATWTSTLTDAGVAARLTGVWAAPGAGVYATGDRIVGTRREGVVLHSDDGVAWTVVKTSTEWGEEFVFTKGFSYTGVWGSGPGHVYVVGSVGVITRFDGTAWVEMASGTRDGLNAIFGTSGTSAWVVGTNGTVLRGTR